MNTPLLVVSKDKARKDINKQIEQGDGLQNRRIGTIEELQAAEEEHTRWTERNIELFAQLFDNDTYARRHSRFRGGLIGNMDLEEQVDYLRNVTREQVNDLIGMRDRLDLIPLKKEMKSSNDKHEERKVDFETASLKWWFHHLPAKYWLVGISTFASAIILTFVGGIYAGQTTFVKEFMGQRGEQPNGQSQAALTPEVKDKLDKLTESHLRTVEKLRTAIIEEEQLAGSATVSTIDHRTAADHLRNELLNENTTFYKELQLLQSFSKQEK
jgi:hypothetical protein